MVALILGTVGSLIGRPKGRPLAGFLLGGGLAIIGIVIIAVMPRKAVSA